MHRERIVARREAISMAESLIWLEILIDPVALGRVDRKGANSGISAGHRIAERPDRGVKHILRAPSIAAMIEMRMRYQNRAHGGMDLIS